MVPLFVGWCSVAVHCVVSGNVFLALLWCKRSFVKNNICSYIHIHTTGVLSTCFCNFFLTTEQIALEPWNLHPSCRIECSIFCTTPTYIRLRSFPVWLSVPLFFWMPIVIGNFRENLEKQWRNSKKSWKNIGVISNC